MGSIRGRCAACHVMPQRSGFPPGWPGPQFPRLLSVAPVVVYRRGEGVETGTPPSLAQGMSGDGRTGRACSGGGGRTGRGCVRLGGV